MSFFSRDAGTSTLAWRAESAFLMRVSISAIGSVVIIPLKASPHYTPYQLALITPGTSPASANCRKHIRHSLNFLKNPRGRPQRKQRFRWRQANFGFLPAAIDAAVAVAIFSSLAIFAVVAICLLLRPERHPEVFQQRQPLGIGLGGGGDADIHSLG